MATTYIFAIGGTGSRVLRSFTMLMASGAAGTSTATEVVPIIFDYDAENGDLKEVDKLMKLYQSIHSSAYDGIVGQAEGNMFFCSPIVRIRDKRTQNGMIDRGLKFNPSFDYAAYINSDSDNQPRTFSDYLGYPQLSGDTEPTQKLLDALYNNSGEADPATEINMDFKVGFKGCPNIGCMVASHFTETPEFKHFARTFNVTNDSIIIVGSVFGGTGASGIPVLLNALRNHPNITRNARISILAMGPYYKISNTIQGADVIDSNTFLAKFRAAMKTYGEGGENSVNSSASRIYYVADGDTQTPLNYCEGGENQKNPAFFAELMGAMCMMDCIGNPPATGAVENPRKITLDEFAPISKFDDSTHQWSVPTKDFDGVDHKNVFRWHHFNKSTLKEKYLRPFVKMAILERFMREYVQAGKTVSGDTWYTSPERGVKSESDFLNNLNEFLSYYANYLRDLRGKHRPMNLINPDTSDFAGMLDDLPLKHQEKVLKLHNRTTWEITNKKVATAMGESFATLLGKPTDGNVILKVHDFVLVASTTMNNIDSDIADHTNKYGE